ncbi:MAG TPA: ubiquitin-like small modifier protein 1 [Gaiellaceae bacterium]|nr:ubiquitin-like small modifier protein 1 [Gaiellaceae bacterium]
MPQIRIPPVLRTEAGGNRSVAVDAATVREALDALVGEYPALDGRILADGALPTFLNVFVDGEDVRLLAGLDTELREGSTVLLLPAVAGGSDSATILLENAKRPRPRQLARPRPRCLTKLAPG